MKYLNVLDFMTVVSVFNHCLILKNNKHLQKLKRKTLPESGKWVSFNVVFSKILPKECIPLIEKKASWERKIHNTVLLKE